MVKAVIVLEGTFKRSVSVAMPSGMDAADLVAALNSAEASQVGDFFIAPNRFSVRIEKNSPEFPPSNWRVESVEGSGDSSAEGGCCGCGGCDASADAQLEAEGLVAVKLAERNKHLRLIKSMTPTIFDLITTNQLSAAQGFIAAASKLYELAGGGDCDEGVWLLSLRSFVSSAHGKHPAAWKHGLKAINMARTVYGEGSPSFAVVLNNIAEGRVDAKLYEQGEKLLLQGVGLLNKAIADGTVDIDWAVSARAEALKIYRIVLRNTGREEEADGLQDH